MSQTRSLVGTLGSIGAAMNHSGTWDLILHLKPWAGHDGKPMEEELRVEIPATEPQQDVVFRRFKNGQVIRVRFTQLKDPGSTAIHEWVARGRLPVERVRASAKLVQARRALEATVVVRDPILGRVTRQRRADEFAVMVLLGARRCEMTIACSGRGDDPDRDGRDVARASALLAKVQRDLAKTLDAVTRRSLPLYNRTWRQDRAVLTRATFRDRLTPSSLSIHDDGSATLWVDSGDLFYDHAIDVRLDPRGAIEETGLA